MVAVVVGFTDPPPVKLYGSSNNWSVPIVVTLAVNNITGLNCGIVIEKNCLTFPAPSILAASYKSSEIFCKPANIIIILYPVHLQIITRTIDILAQTGSFNHPILSIPTNDNK